MLKVVSIGGFGHSVFVFDDMVDMKEAQLVGLAPAFADEDIRFFSDHTLCRGVPQYPDYHQMIKEVKPDVAIISTRLNRIPQIIMDAAEAGCHIIAEKPLALNRKDLERVRRAVEKNNVRLTAMLSMRSEPQFIAAQNIYRSGRIGQAVLVNGRKSYKYGTRPGWFGDEAQYGGTIGWVGIHAFDFINFVTGLTFTKVAAMQGNFAHPERPACQDHCALVAELSNGGHCTISIDLLRPAAASTHGDDWIRVVGTKGVLEARGSDLTCRVLVDSSEPISIELPPKSKMFRDFLLSLNGDPNVETYQEESFMLTDVCLCAETAARTQSVVSCG